MKKTHYQLLPLAALLLMLFLLICSCAPQIQLTSSWSDKQAKVKKSPVIMVMVLGKANSTVRQEVEKNIVARLKKDGFKTIPASDIFPPGITKSDSAGLVNTLRKNNIDLLLTNAVVSETENTRFIPGAVQGTDITVPGGGVATPYNPYNSTYVGIGYYNYYNYYSSSYQTIEAQPTPGTTVTDVLVIIESNLYDVATTRMLWHGQSKSYTKQPSKSQINAFSKKVTGDIMKNKLLVK